MNYIKKLSFVFLMFFLATSCEDEVTGTFTATLNISFVNISDHSCFMWTGHDTAAQGSLILAEGRSNTTVSLTVTSYRPNTEGDGGLPYNMIEDYLKVNVAGENGAIIFSDRQKLGIKYYLGTVAPALRVIWDGDKITIESV